MAKKHGKKMGLRLALRAGGIVLGNALYAAAVTFFIMPNGLITGGTTGLALFLNRTMAIPVSLFVSLFNITMFAWGAWVLGRGFALSTAASTFVYPLLLGILEGSGFGGFVLEEKLAAVVCAGLLIGAGIGIVMRAGASTGGMDIPALILKKRFGLSVSFTIYLMDCLVLGLQLLAAEPAAVLYGILLILTYTLTLDKVLLLGTAKVQVKIISRQFALLNRLIGEQLDCGTSLLHMETGWLHAEQKLILAVLPGRELPRLSCLVQEHDPEAFMIVNQINEVRGRGFTLKKVYREAEEAGDGRAEKRESRRGR